MPRALPSFLLLWMNCYSKPTPLISLVFLCSFCKLPQPLPHYPEPILLTVLYKDRQSAPTFSVTIILSLLDRTCNLVLFSPIFALNSISLDSMDCSCYPPVIYSCFIEKNSSKLWPGTNFSPLIFTEFTPIKLLLIPSHWNNIEQDLQWPLCNQSNSTNLSLHFIWVQQDLTQLNKPNWTHKKKQNTFPHLIYMALLLFLSISQSLSLSPLLFPYQLINHWIFKCPSP